MKMIRLLLIALALPSLALAASHQVTALNTSTAKTLVVPGAHCLWITIQNVGGNQVNLGLDGGSAYTDPWTGTTGTDPVTGSSPTNGAIVLAAGQSITLYGPWFVGVPIRAIMATGTTTLQISTSDASSTFPTN